MKRLSLILLAIAGGILATLLSCTRSVERNATEPESAYIEFKIDNSLKQYVEINTAIVRVSPSKAIVSFVATKQPQASNLFELSFTTDTLRPGMYTVGNTGMFSFREGNWVATTGGAGTVSITIASYANGKIHGTFSGSIMNWATSSPCAVIEGKIHNVSIQ